MKAQAKAAKDFDLRDRCSQLNLTSHSDDDKVLLSSLYCAMFIDGGKIEISDINGGTVTTFYLPKPSRDTK